MLNKFLAERKKEKSVMVMTHVVCGYPSFEDNWAELEVMQEFDVDMVELQFPFSEPSADGPLFVKANQEAIDSGVTVDDCFAFMEKASKHFSFKIVMMGYYNTVFKTGHRVFLERLQAAGAAGFILPDLPIDEAGELHEIAKELDLSPVVLMTPTNRDDRLQALADVADGFIYAVARKGVTGSDTSMDTEVTGFIDRCKKVTDLPLAIGFGVSDASDIKFIAEHADIAVIGTAALRAWENAGKEGLRDFFNSIFER